MKLGTRITLAIIAVMLIPPIVGLQKAIDPARKQFQPGRGVGSVMTDMGNNPVVLPSQFVAGTVIGLQEVVAGLLCVRTDEFFHSGNYEAIIPMVRMITWLDPHMVDVYSVGAWHLDYNFVDSGQRADHRYVVPAIKFLEEGIANNPSIFDLYFDLAFVHYYLKIGNFEKAEEYMRLAAKHNPPFYVYREIAHALEKQGRVDDAIKQWQECIKIGQEELARNPKDTGAVTHIQVSKRNLDSTLIRKVERANLGSRPTDMGFDANFKRLGPRQFLISGKINVPDGARVFLTLTDSDYKEPTLKNFSWDVDTDATALWETQIHGISINKGKFHKKYDLSKDIKQYPFKKDKYTLTLWFDPRCAPISAQDITGWKGEGITDKQYLDTSIPGVKMVKKVITLNRQDIL